MNILFTVCGRAGSKGIKNKNIKDFLGYPLVYYTMAAIDLYQKEHPVYSCDLAINTDSKELIEMVQDGLNIPVHVIERESSLGQDDTPKVAVIAKSLDQMMEQKRQHYDMVVDLDITSPLRTVADIEKLIQKKLASEADVVFSVTDARRNPYFNMVKQTENGYERVIASNFNARQQAPEIFDMNASLYAYSPSFLQSGKGIFDGICEIIKMKDTAVLDLDHEGDFELMEVIAKHLFAKDKSFGRIRAHIEQVKK
ncbi:acylneuraminate cytidylyltransferase family protein [Virgibacillus sp. MG-45]|uniref:acylneuraminate cytidylyltransferase family protein n=1 Tax=Virgibacillus sp. MG-45 TaxID=3102791 RepID=UPI002EDA14E1